MSWPSFLRGIIDRFKKGWVDSDDCIEETKELKGRGRDFSRNQERWRDPPPQWHERPRQGQQGATVDTVGSFVELRFWSMRPIPLIALCNGAVAQYAYD